MNSLALCSLLLTLCFFLFAHSPSLTNARDLGDGSDLIAQLCNENPEKKIECSNVLRADPKVLSAKNFFELAEAILELGLKKGIEGKNFLKGLMVKTKKDVPTIEGCEIYYESTVDSFRNSLIKLKDDPRIANYLADVAGDGPKSCEADLSAAHIANREISDLNHQTDFLSYLAFFATARLVKA